MKKLLFILFIIIMSCQLTKVKAQDFKPGGNFWGYVFGDYYFKAHSDTLGRAPSGSPYGTGSLNSKNQTLNSTNAFQLRRAYLGYDYNLSEKFSASAVLAHEMNLDANGYNTVYLKYAWIKWSNIFRGSNIMMGQLPTSSFATPFGTEPLWGYRSVEKTIIDIHGTDPSTDLGFMLIGNLWQQKTNGDTLKKAATIGYSFMIANGTGAKPEIDRFKKFRVNLYTNLWQQRITVGVYADYNPTQLSPFHTSNTTFKGYAHFKSDWFRIGVEAFGQINQNGDIYKTSSMANADTSNGMQFGFSVFASGRIIKNKLNIFARIDMYNTDTKYNSSYTYSASAVGGNMTTSTFYKQFFFLAGLDYTPIPRLHFMPNIWFNQNTSLMNNDASGKPLAARLQKDYDLIPRLSGFFMFNTSKKVSNNGMDY